MKLPNGFGSICKLSGKRRNPYIVRKTISLGKDGKANVKIVGYYPKYADAMQALLEYNNDPSLYDAKKITFESVYNALYKEKLDDASKHMQYTYNKAYERCKPLYKLSIQSIRLQQINNVINSAPTDVTKRTLRTVLNQIFCYALRNEIITRNPVENAIIPQVKQSEKHQPFTQEELKLLWSNTNDVNARYWLIYIYTGMRPGELVTILTENVHLEDNYMIGGSKTEFGKNRMIPLADCIKPFIVDFYNPDNKYLIRPLSRTIDKDKPLTYNSMRKNLDVFCKAHNLDHIAHDGRHTCATLLNEADINLTTIQFILGHTPQNVTGRVYVHRTLQTMLEAVNKLPHY